MNRQKIEEMRYLAKLQNQIKKVVSEIYACFAKALYDEGKDVEYITDLFTRTQELWFECADDTAKENMIKWVEETTGIEVQGRDYVE